MNWRNRIEQRVRLRSLVCAPADAAVKIAPKVRDSIAQGAALGTEAANNDHPNGVTFPVVGAPGNRAPLGLTTIDGGINPGLRPGLWSDAASRLRRVFGPSITIRYHSLVNVGARFSRHLAVSLSPRRVVSRAAGASPRLCPSHRGARQRDGYTLVELIVVISINSVLMAIAVGLLGVLMRSDQAARQHWTQTSAPARLAAQFRADVAAALTANIVQGKAAGANPPATAQPDVLRLQGPADHTIEFHREGPYVRRIESHGAAVLRREAYMIPDLTGVVFQNRLAHGRFVSLTLRVAGDAGSAGTWQMTAQLAKDLRFAEAAQAQPESAP